MATGKAIKTITHHIFFKDETTVINSGRLHL